MTTKKSDKYLMIRKGTVPANYLKVIGRFEKDDVGFRTDSQSTEKPELIERLFLASLIACPEVIGSSYFDDVRVSSGYWLPEEQFGNFRDGLVCYLLESPDSISNWSEELNEHRSFMNSISRQMQADQRYQIANTDEFLGRYLRMQSYIWSLVFAAEQYIQEYGRWFDNVLGNSLSYQAKAELFLNTLIPKDPTFLTSMWIDTRNDNKCSGAGIGYSGYLRVAGNRALDPSSLDWDTWNRVKKCAFEIQSSCISRLKGLLSAEQYSRLCDFVCVASALQHWKEEKNCLFFYSDLVSDFFLLCREEAGIAGDIDFIHAAPLSLIWDRFAKSLPK